jgi:peptide/nickel transport system permease protein
VVETLASQRRIVPGLGKDEGALIAGAIYVEVTFALPGIGTLMVDAVRERDIPVIQGTTLFFSAFVVAVHLVIDLVYVMIDPRIRFGSVAA